MVVDFDVAFGANGSAPVQNGVLVGEHDDMRLGGVLPTVEVADVDGDDLLVERLVADEFEQLDSGQQIGGVPDLARLGRLGVYAQNAFIFADG